MLHEPSTGCGPKTYAMLANDALLLTSRPGLLHRDHVLHELVDGDLRALVKT